jgi:hypothetical protein
MNIPFEEPAKVDMRADCSIAIDQAGHQLVESVVSIDIPDETKLRGRLKGDLQSLDGEGNRYCYYIRPRSGDTLPEWLANLATAAHSVAGVKLYVVVESASPAFEKACKAAGAGLLVVNDDKEFEMVLEFDSTLPEAIEEVFKENIARVRRSLEAKTDLRLGELQGRFEKIGELTQGMDPDVADQYINNVERQYKIWSEWGDQTSAHLDAVLAHRDAEELEALVHEIERGPVLDDDV